MADFSATLRATLAKLGEPSPEMRQKVYGKAREAIERKIDAMPTRPPQAAIDRQYEKLDAAIADVETDYEPSADELEDDFDDVLLAADEPEPVQEAEPVAVADDVETEAQESTPEEPPAKAEDPLKAFLEQQDQAAFEDVGSSEPVSPPPPRSPEALIAPVARRDDVSSLDVEPKPAMAQDTDAPAVDDWLKSDGPAVEPSDDSYEEGSRRWGLIGALVALVLIFGALIFAAIAYQDELMAMMGGDTVDGVPVRTVESTPVETGGEATDEGTDDVASATDGENVEKFTQRLTEDGTEVDEGPVGGAPTQGEGSTVASQSAGTAEPADPATGDSQAAVPLPVGQRALFYEERTGTQAGTSFPGAAIWSVVQEAPAVGIEPEPAIRAEASVPDLGIVMEMIIKRNGDTTLPASHIAELFFRVPDTFEGRGIADIQRITLKETESDPGNALIAVPAPLDTNIFLIALNDAATAVESNLGLLANQEWIDIPMQYVSGRRALITLEKGSAGKAVFDEVLEYWGQNPLTQ